jgi:hypothetical protein
MKKIGDKKECQRANGPNAHGMGGEGNAAKE